MQVLDELFTRKIIKSKRELSRLIGRAPNFISESRGSFAAADLVEIRLHLLNIGGHDDLVAHVEGLILSSWRA